MNVNEVRLLQVEGQIQALARAWLYLAANAELQGLLDHQVLDRSMLSTHWHGAPFEPHAIRTMQQLVDELTEARVNREHQGVVPGKGSHTHRE